MAKSKWVSLLLCLFFGIFGAHKFYEGMVLLGIVYLCTLGLAGVGATITSLIFSLGIGVGMLLRHRHYENKLEEVERETADACLAAFVYETRCKKCTGQQATDEKATSVAEEISEN